MTEKTQKINNPGYTTKQHFIPQFLLKNFTAEKKKKGNLYEYKKSTKELRERHTNQVAFVPDLYSIETETERNDAIEKQFSEMETIAAPIIEKVITHTSLSILSAEECEKLAIFLTSLYSRSAYAVKFMNSKVKSEVESVKERILQAYPNKGTTITAYMDHIIKTKGLFYANTINPGNQDTFKKVIQCMAMALYKIPRGYFILSDRYTLLCYKTEPSYPVTSQIQNLHAIYCPISSDMCVVFRESKYGNFGNSVFYHKELQLLTDSQLARINNLAVKSCNQYLYCEDEATLQCFT